MKRLILLIMTSLVTSYVAMGEMAVTNVTAKQRYPWNGKVDISYTAKGILQYARNNNLTMDLRVVMTDHTSGKKYVATQISGDDTFTDGIHSVTWDLLAQGINFASTNVSFNVSCETNTAWYCVVDLAGGPNAEKYPVKYYNGVPDGGWPATGLVLKRMTPGKYESPGYGSVSVRGFYIGISLVSGMDLYLVTGSNSSPNYDEIHSSNGFMQRLRTKTGLAFEIPTTSMWEYCYCEGGFGTSVTEWCSDGKYNTYRSIYMYPVKDLYCGYWYQRSYAEPTFCYGFRVSF